VTLCLVKLEQYLLVDALLLIVFHTMFKDQTQQCQGDNFAKCWWHSEEKKLTFCTGQLNENDQPATTATLQLMDRVRSATLKPRAFSLASVCVVKH
jgi:hypothetical protein